MTIKTLKNDILAGITVAIVALPLALAFGVVSGAGAIAGLYGAIILGFIAALLGGVAVQVSGPTGPDDCSNSWLPLLLFQMIFQPLWQLYFLLELFKYLLELLI